MSNLCCKEMETHVENKDVAITYNSKFREYGIAYLDGGSSVQLIESCPWCGSKLPTSLRDKWFSEIGKLGLEPGDSKIPTEFNSDKWWVEK